MRASLSPARRLSSHRSQAEHPKTILLASLFMLLQGQACLNKIRSRWLSSRRREPRTLQSRRSFRNALIILIILISNTARLVVVSYPNSSLSSFAVYYRVYLSEGEGGEKAKTSFDESDLPLGRINTLFIAPPHIAGSLKACVAKVEGLVTPGHAQGGSRIKKECLGSNFLVKPSMLDLPTYVIRHMSIYGNMKI